MRRILRVAVAVALVAGSAGAQSYPPVENGVNVPASVSGTAAGVPGGFASLSQTNLFQYSDLFQLVGPVAPAQITFRLYGTHFSDMSYSASDFVHSGNANTTATVSTYDGVTASTTQGTQTVANTVTLSQLGDGSISEVGAEPDNYFRYVTLPWTGGYFNFTVFARSTASITSTVEGADATGYAQLTGTYEPNNVFALVDMRITDANGNSVFGPNGPDNKPPANPIDRIYIQSGEPYLFSTYGNLDSDVPSSYVSISAAPEPSSIALLGTGLIALVPMVKRKKH